MGKFVGRNFRRATILVLDRLSCARRKNLLFSRTDRNCDPCPNRGDTDENKRCVEKGFRYCESREADREKIVVRQRLKTRW